jgi:hypothetical protein
MDLNILDIGNQIKLVDMVKRSILMAISMRVIGKKIKLMVMENIKKLTEHYTKVNGETIYRTVKE